MHSSPLSTAVQQQRTRAQELADTYTASELAALLAANEALVVSWRDRANVYGRALASISRGEWTAEGARIEAVKALDR